MIPTPPATSSANPTAPRGVRCTPRCRLNANTIVRAPQPLEGTGANEPMLWTLDYGKGHIFVTALGHDVEQVQTPAFMTTFARGAEWAATGKVTLPIPAAMAK